MGDYIEIIENEQRVWTFPVSNLRERLLICKATVLIPLERKPSDPCLRQVLGQQSVGFALLLPGYQKQYGSTKYTAATPHIVIEHSSAADWLLIQAIHQPLPSLEICPIEYAVNSVHRNWHADDINLAQKNP